MTASSENAASPDYTALPTEVAAVLHAFTERGEPFHLYVTYTYAADPADPSTEKCIRLRGVIVTNPVINQWLDDFVMMEFWEWFSQTIPGTNQVRRYTRRCSNERKLDVTALAEHHPDELDGLLYVGPDDIEAVGAAVAAMAPARVNMKRLNIGVQVHDDRVTGNPEELFNPEHKIRTPRFTYRPPATRDNNGICLELKEAIKRFRTDGGPMRLVHLTGIGEEIVYLVTDLTLIDWLEEYPDLGGASRIVVTVPGTDEEIGLTCGSAMNDKQMALTGMGREHPGIIDCTTEIDRRYALSAINAIDPRLIDTGYIY